jgi:serine/threonine-protein kinase
VLGLTVPVGALVLARRNLRLRRGDRKGAWRVAAFVFVAYSVARLCRADHVPGFGEFWLLIKVFAYPMAWAALVWILYVALEPYARRSWPRILISWGRLLAGRWRDPMVGRDVLLGAAAGAILTGLYAVAMRVYHWLAGRPQEVFWTPFFDPRLLTTWADVAFRILVNVYAAALWSLIWLFVLVLLRIVLRRNLLALVAWCVAESVPNLLALGLPGLILALPGAAFELLVLTRLGLLGFGSYYLVGFLLTELPLTFDASLWWAPRGFVALAVVAAIGAYGFRTALAGKPAFGDWLET